MKEEIVYIKVKDLKGNPNNPRKNDEAVEAVAKSIEKYGFRNPLIVDANKVVWCGNTRLKASKKLKLDEVPCIIVKDLSEQQMTELALLDNKTNEIAEWDNDMLADILKEVDLSDFSLDWNLPEIDTPKEVEEDNFDVDSAIPEEPKAKLGDIYQLGEHRLMCGDSTKEEDVAKLMDGAKADMVFTDPPYNVAYEGGSKKREMIKNDKMDNFYEFLYDVYQNCYNNMNAGAPIYVCHSELERINFTKSFIDVGFKMSSIIIWAKNNSTFSMNKDYKQKHEPIIYGWKEGKHNWVGGNCEDTLWEIKRPAKSDLHPTMKPIELCARAITNSSNKNNIVYEPFGGSGSTLIASEQTNRICYCMELDPKYVDVIIARWEDFTGKKAEKIN